MANQNLGATLRSALIGVRARFKGGGRENALSSLKTTGAITAINVHKRKTACAYELS